MSNLKEHDNTDRDIIIINKDSLLLRILHCKDYYTSQVAAPTFLGIAISLMVPGLLSESFRNIGPVPGETIRVSLIVLGVITFVLAGYFFWKWYQSKDTHEPQNIINSLLKNNKNDQSQVFKEENKNKLVKKVKLTLK